ncbi:MAG: hypothetical protein JWO36_1192 [Myxococcales bacterium]|nr:hypothetical protein [Myxococcales bacterium]
MRSSIGAVMLAVLGCSSHSSVSNTRPLTIYTPQHRLLAQLEVDGTITDSVARVVTHYDAKAQSMSLLGATLDVAQSVHVTGPRELDLQIGPLEPWHVSVTSSNEIEVNDHLLGRVEGLDVSAAGMFRLGILLCVVPVISPPTPLIDAALPIDADLRPPPPPPPIPRTQQLR